MYRKAASNPTTGQVNPLPYTPIEDADISKSTNRLTTDTTYDEAGQVTTDNKFRDMSFGYDANGRMVKAAKPNVPDALSVYDASGMRVAEKVNDVWRFSIYDIGGKCVAEYGGLNSADEGGVKYVLQDWQGSTRALVGNTGYVKARMDYTAFGEDIGSGTGLRIPQQGFGISDSLRQRYGLTERDDATGLDHTWFRKNENRAGRWTSPDPYNGSMRRGSPQSFNRYSYVLGQPTNFVDPSGLNQQAPDQACETRPGSDIYDGRIIDGRCVAYGTSPVNIYWTGGWINMGGNNTTWVPAGGYPEPGAGGGGGNNPQPSSPTSVPVNRDEYACTTLSAGPLSAALIRDSNNQLYPSFSAGPSWPMGSVVHTYGNGPVTPGVYLFFTASNGPLAATTSFGTSGMSREAGFGTPTVSGGIQVVLPKLEGSTEQDSRNNPHRGGSGYRYGPGRCPH